MDSLSTDTDENLVSEASSGSLIYGPINRPCPSEEEYHGARPKTGSSYMNVGASAGSQPKMEAAHNPTASSSTQPESVPAQHIKAASSPEEQKITQFAEGCRGGVIKKIAVSGEKIQGKHWIIIVTRADMKVCWQFIMKLRYHIVYAGGLLISCLSYY